MYNVFFMSFFPKPLKIFFLSFFFRCHSFVLAINSPYLCAVVKDSSLENTELDFQELKIKDCDENSSATRKGPPTLTEAAKDEKVKDVSSEGRDDEKSPGKDYPSKLTQTSFSQGGVASPCEQKKVVVLKGFEPDVFSKVG